MTLTLFFAAIIHCLVILLVGTLPLTWKVEGKVYDTLLSFGAGVLLSAAFLHMLPAAIPVLGPSVGLFTMGGYVLMTILERFTMAHPCGEHGCPNHRLGLVALLGLSVHSIIAGMALGVGLLDSADFSTSAALMAAILVHKIPETLALMGLIAGARWPKKSMTIALVVFSLMGPAGILLGSVQALHSPKFLSCALAISAGTFLYIASSDLLPQLHKKMKQEWIYFIAFLLGLCVLAMDAAHHLAG